MFALLYLVSQALVYSAEIAAVRYAGLWPRALDQNRPTAADVRASPSSPASKSAYRPPGSTSALSRGFTLAHGDPPVAHPPVAALSNPWMPDSLTWASVDADG